MHTEGERPHDGRAIKEGNAGVHLDRYEWTVVAYELIKDSALARFTNVFLDLLEERCAGLDAAPQTPDTGLDNG